MPATEPPGPRGPAQSEPARVAAVQFEPTLFRKAENTEALLRLAEEAARGAAVAPAYPGRDVPGLVVLPEMATTGYVFRDREEIAPFVEPIPGPTTQAFGRLARRRGVSLVIGLPEVDPATGAFYNSAALIGPDGEVAGVYRKTHSFHCDTLWAAEGNLGLPVFDGPWPGPLGLFICMDAGFFETARVMALAGARVLAFPTNWLRAAPSPEWRARAAENGMAVVAANRWGEERGVGFAGGTCVIGPRGEILAQKDRGDGVVVAAVDLAAEAAPAAWVRRRPDLYHALARHPYLWPERFNFTGLGAGRFALSAASEAALEASGEDHLARLGSRLPGEPGARVLVLPPTREPALVAAAAATGTYLVGSWAGEVRLVGPEGPIGRYRSPHLAAAGEAPAAARGVVFPTFDLPFGRVGLLEPLDLLLPEPARLLAKEGADMILASGVWPAELDDLRFLWAERAEANDLWLAVAVSGSPGRAPGGPQPDAAVFVSGERGAELPGLPGVVSLTGETGPGSPSRRKDRLRRLRPDLYLSLAEPSP